MRNYDQKITDMIRSVLPSTARQQARKTRRLIHRSERRTIRAGLRAARYRGDLDTVVDVRGPISDMVAVRRDYDNVAALVRWALHRVHHDPDLCDASIDEQVEHFRHLLPDTKMGRHALSHIEWPLELETWTPAGCNGRRRRDIAPVVRALYEAGYHRELNSRLKTNRLPLLAGLHDIARFSASADRATSWIVTTLAAEAGVYAEMPRGRSSCT